MITVKFKEVNLSDLGLFDQFLKRSEHCLSTYHFCNIFIWKKLFRIFYTVLNECLCIFFKDSCGTFMYLPVLGKQKNQGLEKACFGIMDKLNVNKNISRIENVEDKHLPIYQRQGYKYNTKPSDFVYKRDDLALLEGSRFKSKRNLRNYFIKNHDSNQHHGEIA